MKHINTINSLFRIPNDNCHFTNGFSWLLCGLLGAYCLSVTFSQKMPCVQFLIIISSGKWGSAASRYISVSNTAMNLWMFIKQKDTASNSFSFITLHLLRHVTFGEA